MAPKAPSSRSREPSADKPVKEPSDDETEEEGSSSEEEEEEEEEEEDEKQDQQNLKINKTPNPVAKSESKSTDADDSETESEGSPSNYKLQPVLKPHAPTGKRPNQEDGVGGSNKKSKKTKTEEKKPSTPGGCITRVWSDEDEIAVLNGLIDYRALNGANADMGAFYDFIKGKLQAEISRIQLKTKIRRLRDRFNNALKKCENGCDPVFSKPHEDISFDLSKKIWGAAASVGNTSNGSNKKIESNKKGIVKAKKETANHKEVVKEEDKETANEKEVVKEDNNRQEVDFWSKYPSLNESFPKILRNFPSFAMSESGVDFMKKRLSLIGSAKAEQLDEKWRQLIVKEMEINHKMLALMTEQVEMALDK